MAEHQTEQDLIKELLHAGNSKGKMSEKKARIVEAAVEMFSEKGYAATSTSEIAKKADVAEGTIFRHYKTKKDLLMCIVTPLLTKFAAPFLAKDFVKQVFKDDYQSYESFIRALVLNRYEFFQKHLPILKIFLQELAFHPEIKEEFQKVFTENVYQRFTEIIVYFQRKGEITRFPPQTVIRLTMTTIIGFFLTRFLILPEQDWNDEEEIEMTIHFLMHGLKSE